MYLYHVIDPKAVSSVMNVGLRCDSRGDKGQDSAIIKTDHLLDELCPAELRVKGISRDNNLYAYLADEDTVISIVDGSRIAIDELVEQSSQAVARITVIPKRCYVSDLDAYDKVKARIETAGADILADAAKNYWECLVPLDKYRFGAIRRPEVMIPYDISPADIKMM